MFSVPVKHYYVFRLSTCTKLSTDSGSTFEISEIFPPFGYRTLKKFNGFFREAKKFRMKKVSKVVYHSEKNIFSHPHNFVTDAAGLVCYIFIRFLQELTHQ